MKLTCAKSGLILTTPEFRHSLPDNSHSHCHPIFSASPKLLLRAYDDWSQGKLRDEETILLFLAIADSTELIRWRAPFQITENAAGIFNLHMEDLARTVGRLAHLQGKGLELPAYVCERQNAQNTAGAFSRCVSTWKAEIAAFADRSASATRARNLLRLEEHLDRARLIAQKRPGSYAKAVASWAATVGDFPTRVTCTARHASISLREYWAEVIEQCVLRTGRPDTNAVAEILAYCEENVPAGSTHACALFDSLRQHIKDVESKYGFSLVATSQHRIPLTVQEEEQKTKEVALLRSIREGATSEKPKREDFLTQFAFMRALAVWNTAQIALPGDLQKAPAPATSAPISQDNNSAEDL